MSTPSARSSSKNNGSDVLQQVLPLQVLPPHALPAVAPQYDGWGVLFGGASSRDDASGDEPELRLEHALEEVLSNASDARSTRVEATLIDRKTSRG